MAFASAMMRGGKTGLGSLILGLSSLAFELGT
jgi:hypothetical protein